MSPPPSDVLARQRILLRRRGLVFPAEPSRAEHASAGLVRAVEIELAGLGCVLSSRLSARLMTLSPDELARCQSWLQQTLASHLGAGLRHQPLFRHFPHDIPEDTAALWWSKVLAHYPRYCLLPGRTSGTFAASGLLG